MAEIDMTDQEKKAVEELRRRMKNIMKPEMLNENSIFYRFLKARDFNLDNAESMLRKHLEWRKEYEVDEILTNYKKPEVYEKYFPNNMLGFDKEGSPCRYVALGDVDSKGFMMVGDFVDLYKSITYDNECDMACLKEQSEKLGKNVDKCIYIYDFSRMTFAKATDKAALNAMIRCVTLYQDNYPERLKAAYAINSSIYFTIIFTVIKSFVANSILKKIHILSEEGWKEEFRKMFDLDELPAFLGGNKTDPDGDPYCKSFVSFGGKIPERYYVRKSKKSLMKSSGCKKFTLGRSSFNEITVEVKEPNSLIEWEFATKSRDVGFGLFYQDAKDNEAKELIPVQRIHTDDYPETGMYRCEKPGEYILLFDNTYSWLRSKDIYYKVVVVNSKDHEADLIK